ncbi:MAG: phytoene dehydrogenase [Gemmatimonadetes bacterium]|nr:phytoene dehydrogenase [Gemmatimonadota bacterium]
MIGSGAGGLACAVALAQAGQRVLVLEQHEVPGGWCHSFRLGGYQFSPGVHYIGELDEGGGLRRVYEGLGVSRDLVFLELNPDGFDHVLIGGERFDIPKGRNRLEARLIERFPHESRGIRDYLELVDRSAKELGQAQKIGSLPDLLSLPWRARHVLRWGLASLDHVLDRHVHDPMLRALLSIQAGDHGLPPSKAPFALHAAVQAHYFNGGFYPMGGAQSLPKAFARALRRAGGGIRLNAAVDRILLGENGAACGVRLAGGEEITATRVVSNADPGITFGRLVGLENLSTRLRSKLARTRWSISGLSLFGATDLDLADMGYDSGNYWYSRSTNLEASYDFSNGSTGLDDEELPGLFLTITTLKDRTKKAKGHQTFEAFTFVPFGGFDRWSDSRHGDRPGDYVELKKRLEKRMLRAADKVVPGISEHSVFAELATPLTNAHYVRSTKGSFYGTEKSRWQLGPFGFGVATEVSDLWLCGASTLGHGVMGATASGLAVAARILRCSWRDLLDQRGPDLRIYPADDPSAWPPQLRRKRRSADNALARSAKP